MGKVLVINDADFSANSAGEIYFNPYFLKVSGFGVTFLDYQGRTSILESKASSVSEAKLFVYKLSPELIGKTISIKSSQLVISGASYSCFSKDLGELSFNEIPDLNGIVLPDDVPIYHDIQASSILETFNVSVSNKVINTINKVVPTDAQYLLVTGFLSAELPEVVITVLD